MGRVYVTRNSEYKVDHLTPDGREVIFSQRFGDRRQYAIVGFADPKKLGSVVFGNSRYWQLRDSKKHLKREGELEKELEKSPRSGLQIVAWLVDEKGNNMGPREGIPDEMVTSAIKEVRIK